MGEHPVLDFGEGPVHQAPGGERKKPRLCQRGLPAAPARRPCRENPGVTASGTAGSAPSRPARSRRTHSEPSPTGRLRGAPAAPTHSADSRQQLQGGAQRGGGLRGAAGGGGSRSAAAQSARSRSGPAMPAPPLPAGRPPPPPAP